METVRAPGHAAHLSHRQGKDHPVDRLGHHPPFEETEIATPRRFRADGNFPRHLIKILPRLQSFQDPLRPVAVGKNDLRDTHPPIRGVGPAIGNVIPLRLLFRHLNLCIHVPGNEFLE